MKFSSSKFLRTVCGLILAGSLFACTGEVKQSLSENEADQIMVALKERGIDAEKKMMIVNREKTYTVTTNKSKLDDARRILVILGLPRAKVAGIEEICGTTESLIPSPSIDRCKFQLALQNEIVKALVTIDGVVEAKVNINLPEANVLSDQPQAKPTAAVMIKFIPDAAGKAPFVEKQVREYVANSVDNLDYNDVSILATPARSIRAILRESGDVEAEELAKKNETKNATVQEASVQPALLGLQDGDGSVKKMKVTILVLSVLFLVLAVGMIVTVLHTKSVKAAHEQMAKQQRRMRMQAQRALKPAAGVPAVASQPLAGNVTMPSGFDGDFGPGPGGNSNFGVN